MQGVLQRVWSDLRGAGERESDGRRRSSSPEGSAGRHVAANVVWQRCQPPMHMSPLTSAMGTGRRGTTTRSCTSCGHRGAATRTGAVGSWQGRWPPSERRCCALPRCALSSGVPAASATPPRAQQTARPRPRHCRCRAAREGGRRAGTWSAVGIGGRAGEQAAAAAARPEGAHIRARLCTRTSCTAGTAPPSVNCSSFSSHTCIGVGASVRQVGPPGLEPTHSPRAHRHSDLPSRPTGSSPLIHPSSLTKSGRLASSCAGTVSHA